MVNVQKKKFTRRVKKDLFWGLSMVRKLHLKSLRKNAMLFLISHLLLSHFLFYVGRPAPSHENPGMLWARRCYLHRIHTWY